MESPKNIRLLWIFSIALVSVILITSQSNSAFAGIEDYDNDGVGTQETCGNGDCGDPDDNDPCNPNPDAQACIDRYLEIVEDVEDYVIEVGETLENMEDISPGQISGIVGKLENAAEKLEDGNVNGSIGSLNAFINQIEALINSGKLTELEGGDIITVVEGIISSID